MTEFNISRYNQMKLFEETKQNAPLYGKGDVVYSYLNGGTKMIIDSVMADGKHIMYSCHDDTLHRRNFIEREDALFLYKDIEKAMLKWQEHIENYNHIKAKNIVLFEEKSYRVMYKKKEFISGHIGRSHFFQYGYGDGFFLKIENGKVTLSYTDEAYDTFALSKDNVEKNNNIVLYSDEKKKIVIPDLFSTDMKTYYDWNTFSLVSGL